MPLKLRYVCRNEFHFEIIGDQSFVCIDIGTPVRFHLPRYALGSWVGVQDSRIRDTIYHKGA
jgi:hypothetical protein